MTERAYVKPFGHLGYIVVGPFGNETTPMDKEAAERLAAKMNEISDHENHPRVDTALDAAPPASGQ